MSAASYAPVAWLRPPPVLRPYIAKCANGHVVRGTLADISNVYLGCPCGSRGVAKKLDYVHVSGAACSAKCTDATGPHCSCSCDGENHGADRVAGL